MPNVHLDVSEPCTMMANFTLSTEHQECTVHKLRMKAMTWESQKYAPSGFQGQASVKAVT